MERMLSRDTPGPYTIYVLFITLDERLSTSVKPSALDDPLDSRLSYSPDCWEACDLYWHWRLIAK